MCNRRTIVSPIRLLQPTLPPASARLPTQPSLPHRSLSRCLLRHQPVQPLGPCLLQRPPPPAAPACASFKHCAALSCTLCRFTGSSIPMQLLPNTLASSRACFPKQLRPHAPGSSRADFSTLLFIRLLFHEYASSCVWFFIRLLPHASTSSSKQRHRIPTPHVLASSSVASSSVHSRLSRCSEQICNTQWWYRERILESLASMRACLAATRACSRLAH